MVMLQQPRVGSAERVFELLDDEEQSSDLAAALGKASDGGRTVHGQLEFGVVSVAYWPEKLLITGLSSVRRKLLNVPAGEKQLLWIAGLPGAAHRC